MKVQYVDMQKANFFFGGVVFKHNIFIFMNQYFFLCQQPISEKCPVGLQSCL